MSTARFGSALRSDRRLSGTGPVVNATSGAAGAATITAADAYALDNALSPRFRNNASFLAARAVYNQFRSATDADANFWAAFGGGLPAQMIGYNAYTNEQMDSTIVSGSNDFALILGDSATTRSSTASVSRSCTSRWSRVRTSARPVRPDGSPSGAPVPTCFPRTPSRCSRSDRLTAVHGPPSVGGWVGHSDVPTYPIGEKVKHPKVSVGIIFGQSNPITCSPCWP